AARELIASSRPLSPDDADVPVALEDGEGGIRRLRYVSMQTEILEEVVLAETIARRHSLIDLTIADDDVAASLDRVSERVRSPRPVRQHAVQHDEDEAAAERREERGRPVDRAREHRRENESEHRIERGLLREKSPVAASDNRQSGSKDDDRSQADLR